MIADNCPLLYCVAACEDSVPERICGRRKCISKSRKNPYAKQLKSQITIRLDTNAVNYFKKMAAELGMPYQNLINLFLRDCAIEKRRPVIQWPQAERTGQTGR